MKKVCELCKEEASVYCFADAAFLCLKCDAKVHQANFLVARHLRQFLCSKCKSSFCHQKQPNFMGSQAQTTDLCKACRSDQNSPLPSSSSSSSSDCLSSNCESSSTDFKFKTTTKPTHSSTTSASEVIKSNTNNDNKLEGIFGIWCKKLGLSSREVVTTATAALRLCLERLAVLPFRVSLAAAFWVGLRMSEGQRSVATWQILRRLEVLSGVPAKIIVAVEPQLARAMRLRRRRRRRIRQDLEEGWAECNV